MTTLEIKSKLALRFGQWNSRGKLVYSNNVVAVQDLADASRKWEAFRDELGLSASDSPIVVVVNTTTGEHIAKISYNGRVWDNNGNEIQIDGQKTAAQHESEGWSDFTKGEQQ